MEDLADAMKEVNEQSKNTSRGRNAGRGNNESSSASASIVAASGTGSGNDKLNSIMQEVSAKLDQLGYLETISKNTKTTGSNVLNLAERL
jgi:hypothetical protein